MGNFSHLLISVPLIALPLLAATPQASAGQALRPSDAVRLLAQSRTVDARCHFLAEADHEQLADYVARTEVAAAYLDGVQKTRSALASGNAEGKAMSCDDGSKGMVTATLAAARYAEKSMGPQLARIEEKARRAEQKQQQVALQQPATRSNGDAVPGDSLGAYTRQATAYYIERRCGFLSSSDTMAFWEAIVARHNAMIARYGGDAVTRAKAKAEAGGERSCGAESESLVEAAWSAIQRYR